MSADEPRQRWGYDRPVLRDPLFRLAAVVAVVLLIGALAWGAGIGVAAGLVPGTFFCAGVYGGSVRNARRGWRAGGQGR